jgi:hypothetical protein
MRARVGLLFVAVCLFSESAAAQSAGWSTLFLEPAVSGDGAIGVDASRTLGDDAFSTGILLSYVDAPLRLLPDPEAPAGNPAASELLMIESQIVLDYVIAVAFGRQFQVGAGIPVVLSESGDFDDVPGLPDGPAATALGDIRAELKYTILSNDGDGPGLALAPQIILPSGDEDSYLGESGLAFHPRLLADFRIGRLGAFGSLGAKVRTKDGALGNTSSYSNELTWGAALSLPIPGLAEAGALLVEYRGATQIQDPFHVEGGDPQELDGALRYLFQPIDLTLSLGGGVGLTTAAGAPAVRGFLGASWRPTEHDEDGDGIADGDDGCATMPEDVDQFEDSDGCPEPDNDRDHVDDSADRCPLEAEDIDQVEDEDGCPDPDADSDGVSDAADRCPEPEDRDSYQDEDGCPDPDNDGDEILDASDRCAMEPEDKDSFQDDDGCPDPDNDGDEILDAADRCATEAEDKDSFEDDDGCPEIDNDHDGVLDATDTCADRAETINGTADDDGCPDAGGAPLARVANGVLRLTGALAFGPNDQPTPATRRILDQLAHVLIQRHPVALRIAYRGANTTQGAARANALRQYLVSKGVPEASAGAVAEETGPGATTILLSLPPPAAATP